MMKKKIAIFILSMGSGGAERFISVILPKLSKDYEVYLVLMHNILHFNVPNNVKIIVLTKRNKLNLLEKIIWMPKLVFTYNKILKHNEILTSLSLLIRPNIINCIIKRFNKNVKVIISERSYPSLYYGLNKHILKLSKFLLPKYYNKADIIFSNSKHINEDLRNNFSINKSMEVIYNPVEYVSPNDLNNVDNKQFDIIWIGKLVPVKNPFMLVEALHNTQRKYKVQILGDGTLYQKMKPYSKNLDIIFRGNVENVFEFINDSKCLVLTSDTEGFPNVILEGLSYGLPVIATNCTSGPLEILNDNIEIDINPGEYKICKYGILIKPNDSIALSKAFDRLLNDSILYQELSKASLVRANDYSIDNIYKQLSNLL